MNNTRSPFFFILLLLTAFYNCEQPVNDSDKKEDENKTAAEEKPAYYDIKSGINHYVQGNFYNSNDYKFIEMSNTEGNIINLAIGLEYN